MNRAVCNQILNLLNFQLGAILIMAEAGRGAIHIFVVAGCTGRILPVVMLVSMLVGIASMRFMVMGGGGSRRGAGGAGSSGVSAGSGVGTNGADATRLCEYGSADQHGRSESNKN
jgi:hypothetical protein